MKRIKILVLTAGSSPAIGVIKSLMGQTEIPVHIIAADSDAYSAGFILSQEKLIVPEFSNKNFIDLLLKYSIKNNIQYIFPPVLNNGLILLSKKKDLFEQNDIKIFISNYSSVLKTIDKRITLKICAKEKIKIPRTFNNIRDIRRNDFPLIIKPSIGLGSKNVWKINDYNDLEYLSKKVKKPIIQQYIEADEFTIDVLNTEKNAFLTAVPRIRLKIKNGQSFQGKIVNDLQLVGYAKHLSKIFKLSGPANIQVFKKNGEILLIEVNPKFGAGSILTFENGVNIPLLLIKMNLGMKISKKEIAPRTGVVMSRYLEEAYFNE